GSADRPGCIRAMDAIGAGAEVERTHAERVHGVPAGHPARQPRVFGDHVRGRPPRGVDLLVGDDGDALPAVLVARNGYRVAKRLTGPRHEIQTPIAKADDDLSGRKLRAKAHEFAPAAPAFLASAPIPEELRGRAIGEADYAQYQACCDGDDLAQNASRDHRAVP